MCKICINRIRSVFIIHSFIHHLTFSDLRVDITEVGWSAEGPHGDRTEVLLWSGGNKTMVKGQGKYPLYNFLLSNKMEFYYFSTKIPFPLKRRWVVLFYFLLLYAPLINMPWEPYIQIFIPTTRKNLMLT